MREGAPSNALSTIELVAMVAALSALNALAIDIMLPALPNISGDFRLANDNDRQLVVVVYVAFFGIAQLVYGPLADAFGRRSILIYALGLFIAGSVLCVVTPNYELFLAARAIQGLGAAATRVIAIAVVRDLMEGRRMAQVMSMAMTVFMIIPIVAPSLGQLILFVAPWRWVFGALLIYALIILAWTLLRLPETLAAENRTPFRPREIAGVYASILRNRQTMGYTIASTFLTGGLFGYVASSEQLFVEVYDLGPAFALAFASIAIAISAGTYLNARLVMRYGMRRISHTMTLWFTAIAAVLAVVALMTSLNLWAFMALLALCFATFGLIASNFNTLAMEPVGHVAGSASALFGAITAMAGAFLGGVIARGFDGTVAPFAIGLALAGAATLASVWLTEGRLTLTGVDREPLR